MKQKKKKKVGLIKRIIKIFYKKTEFIYLGKEIEGPSIIISNHEGSKSPLSWDLYSDKNVAFWGTYEMNSGLKTNYPYLSKIYFHQKKGWNLFLARLFCIIASPVSSLVYKRLDVISTYPDARFKKTIKQTINYLNNNRNIVIFPEMSETGYFKKLIGFHEGVVFFLDLLKKKGIDANVYISYYNKEKNICLIDKPEKYSKLSEDYISRKDLAQKLCDKCNSLGEQTLSIEPTSKKKK